MIHCDLKPENILLDEKGMPHIADFGLAAAAGELHERQVSPGGTLLYASPEQVRWLQGRTGRLDRRSDVWSLGVVLYELLTGRQPFHGTKEGIAEWIEHHEATPPRELNTAIPNKLEEITQICLRREPGDRFHTAGDLSKALRDWLESTASVPEPLDFSAYIQEKLKRYTHRPWLFDEVNAWLAHSGERVLFLTGDMGVGKSTFLAEFVRRNPGGRVLAYHFCQSDTPETLAPSRFVRSLAGMLARSLEGYLEALSSAEREAHRSSELQRQPRKRF